MSYTLTPLCESNPYNFTFALGTRCLLWHSFISIIDLRRPGWANESPVYSPLVVGTVMSKCGWCGHTCIYRLSFVFAIPPLKAPETLFICRLYSRAARYRIDISCWNQFLLSSQTKWFNSVINKKGSTLN